MSTKRFAVLSLFFALGCKSPSATEQMDSIISWLGTAGMVGEAWLRHTTPDKYTAQTLELANQSLMDINNGLFKALPPGIDTASLDTSLALSRKHIGLLQTLVEQKASPDFRTMLDSLNSDERVIKQFADSVEAIEKQ